ncbi:hypothetical protein RIF29_42311 [Crotalaria pallida]|uniref:Uncharacterized protein n=1 Tax=Crotalaria pallida TaxID=3830 RepID=A0AAN9HW66_CROPI
MAKHQWDDDGLICTNGCDNNANGDGVKALFASSYTLREHLVYEYLGSMASVALVFEDTNGLTRSLSHCPHTLFFLCISNLNSIQFNSNQR